MTDIIASDRDLKFTSKFWDCGVSISGCTATTDTHGSMSDTYGRWNIASQRGSWQLRTTQVRHPTDGRHDDVDTKRDDT